MCPFASNLSSIFNILIFVVFISMIFSVSVSPVEYPSGVKRTETSHKKTDAEVLKLQVEKLRLEIELKKLQEKKIKKSKKSVKVETEKEVDTKEFEGIEAEMSDGV